jgi:hypothetical protein
MNNYIFNFFLWWYWVNGKGVFSKLVTNWRYTLEALNLVPMIRNFFSPLYQDYSWEGKLVAVPFRIIWVFFGTIFQIFYTFSLILILIGYLIAPAIPIIIVVINTVK